MPKLLPQIFWHGFLHGHRGIDVRETPRDHPPPWHLHPRNQTCLARVILTEACYEMGEVRSGMSKGRRPQVEIGYMIREAMLGNRAVM